MQKATAAHPVILLLPSPDVDVSVHLMTERLRSAEPDFADDFYDTISAINRTFVEHPSNSRLATLTIYTKGKEPAATCAEIIERL